MMRYSIAAPIGGLRGAGLGNQVFPIAKAWLGARILNQRFVDVPWALNPRGYRSEFGTSRLDFARHRLLSATSRPIRISAEMFASTGESDYVAAMDALIARGAITPKRSTLHDSGMNGGYAAIRQAREYLRTRLTGTEAALRSPVVRNLLHQRAIRPVVGVHVRAGDFGMEPPNPGDFNARLPADWYFDAVRAIASELPEAIYILVTEPDGMDLARRIASEAGLQKAVVTSGSATEDLAVLTQADLIVASVSSFSMLAAFLSDAPYLWYRPQLSRSQNGHTVWSDETSLHFAAMRPRLSASPPLANGFPFSGGESVREVTNLARGAAERRHPESNLIMYGEVR